MSRKCELCDGGGWMPVRHCDCVTRKLGSAQFNEPDPTCQICLGYGSILVAWRAPGQRVRRCVCETGGPMPVRDGAKSAQEPDPAAA